MHGNLDSFYNAIEVEDKKLKLNFDIIIKIQRSQDEISDITGPQNYVDQALLIDMNRLDDKNKIIDKRYTDLIRNQNIINNYKAAETDTSLDLAIINLRKYNIELKSRYIKIIKVTKKIQEIVTGREEINQDQIIRAYDQKKKNLEENKKKRIKDIEEKLEKVKIEIDRKKVENQNFEMKLFKLEENVISKKTIADLGADDGNDDYDNELEGGLKDRGLIPKRYLI